MESQLETSRYPYKGLLGTPKGEMVTYQKLANRFKGEGQTVLQ